MSKTPPGTPLPERIKKCFAAHPDWNDHRVVAAMRCHIADVRTVRTQLSTGKGEKSRTEVAKHRPGMSRKEFLAKYDPFTKLLTAVSAAISSIERGRYYRDCEIRQEAGIHNIVDWASVVRSPEYDFRKYQFKIKDEIFWTDPSTVAEEVKTNPKAKEV